MLMYCRIPRDRTHQKSCVTSIRRKMAACVTMHQITNLISTYFKKSTYLLHIFIIHYYYETSTPDLNDKTIQTFFSCMFLGFEFHHYIQIYIWTFTSSQSSQYIVSSNQERLHKKLSSNDSKTSKKTSLIMAQFYGAEMSPPHYSLYIQPWLVVSFFNQRSHRVSVQSSSALVQWLS